MVADRKWVIASFLLSMALAAACTAVQISRYGAAGVHTLGDLGYDYGALVDSLLNGSGYVVYHDGIAYQAHRLPFIPLFLAGLGKLTSSLALVWLVKNLLFFSLSWLAFWLVMKEYRPRWFWVVAAAAIYFLVRGNYAAHARLDFEEAYLTHLLALIGALLFTNATHGRLLLLSALVVVSSLTKSSMTLPLAAICIFEVVRCRKCIDLRLVRFAPAAALIASWLAWGAFTLQETGKFAFGLSNSSYNGFNFHKGNNEFTKELYPLVHLDRLSDGDQLAPPVEYRDEWQIDSYHAAAGRNFIRQNPREALENTWEKVKVAFWTVKDVGTFPERGEKPGIDGSMLIMRPLFLAAMVISIGSLIRARWMASVPHGASAAFLLITITYTAPFLAGFVYHRHMTPIYTLSCLFLLLATAAVSKDQAWSLKRHNNDYRKAA